MDDVFIIDQNAFRATRPNVVEKLTGSKIDAIFALDCFNESKFKQVATNFKSNSRHQGTTSSSQRFFNQRDAKPPRSRGGVQSYNEKLMREVTSNLNKLNGSNVDAIIVKINKLIDENNINQIVTHIINKSCTNGSYMEHFFALLNNMGHEPIVEECITQFVDDYISNFKATINGLLDLVYDDYDQFCDFVKQKSTIQNKSKLVLFYIKKGTVENCIDTYFDQVLSLVKPSLATHVQDLLIQLVADIMADGTESTYIHLAQELVEIEKFISAKSKFMIQDVMKENEFKHNKLFVCKARRRRDHGI